MSEKLESMAKLDLEGWDVSAAITPEFLALFAAGDF